MRCLRFFSLVFACFLFFGCTKEYPFQKEHLDGHYIVVDYRDVKEGPSVGNEILVGVFHLVVGEDKSVNMSGTWKTTGTAVGLNLKLDPARVTMEDGTDLIFSFGLVEGSRNSFIVKPHMTKVTCFLMPQRTRCALMVPLEADRTALPTYGRDSTSAGLRRQRGIQTN